MSWPLGPRLAGHRTWVMGVMNLTPDSFSDGGRIDGVAQALRLAARMLDQGADILDIGAQSTRPGAQQVGPGQELERLLPALRAIRATFPDTYLSVDTFHAEVADVALAAGASWINDVRGANGGLRDPSMLSLVARWGCPYVLTHSRGDSQSMDGLAVYSDVVAEVHAELQAATATALECGVRPEQILWDPGLGFAKTTEHNLELVRCLPELARDGYPLMLGPSRKRFIGEILNKPTPRSRVWGTASVCALAVVGGARVLRVHDVGPITQVVRMAEALVTPATAY